MDKKNIEWLKERNEYVFNEIFVQNLYGVEPSEIAGKLVLDVGANAGLFSIMCMELGAGMVSSYEPESKNWEELQKNRDRYMKDFMADVDFLTCNMAITGDGRSVSMEGAGGQAQLASKVGAVQVGSRTLSDAITCALDVHASYAKSYRPALTGAVLKMDCEGAEYEILFNSSGDTIRQFDTIYMEGHGEMLHILKSYIRFLGFRQDREIPLFAWDINDLGQKINERRLDVEVMKFTKL